MNGLHVQALMWFISRVNGFTESFCITIALTKLLRWFHRQRTVWKKRRQEVILGHKQGSLYSVLQAEVKFNFSLEGALLTCWRSFSLQILVHIFHCFACPCARAHHLDRSRITMSMENTISYMQMQIYIDSKIFTLAWTGKVSIR